MSGSEKLRRFFVSIKRDTRRYGGLEYEYEHCDHGEFVDAEEAIDLVKRLEEERDALAAKIEKAIQYGKDTLNCNQTLKGQQFAADHFLRILRGES